MANNNDGRAIRKDKVVRNGRAKARAMVIAIRSVKTGNEDRNGRDGGAGGGKNSTEAPNLKSKTKRLNEAV